jgi:hypothetical protein
MDLNIISSETCLEKHETERVKIYVTSGKFPWMIIIIHVQTIYKPK